MRESNRPRRAVKAGRPPAVPSARPQPAALAVETSSNAKLGPISATYASQASCPPSCPWFRNGCYAERGLVGWQTRRLNRSAVRGALRIAQAEARAIDTLTGDRLLRLHVVGDARTDAAARDLGMAADRYTRRGNVPRHGRKVWGYTHAWRTVARSSWGQAVSVLASVETVREAREAMAKGYAAAVVVSAFERPGAYPIDGTTVVPCPHQTRGVTCRECGLCRDDERLRSAGLVIAFEAHGSGGAAVRKTLLSLPTV
jgi:hypothetical protein